MAYYTHIYVYIYTTLCGQGLTGNACATTLVKTNQVRRTSKVYFIHIF